MADYFDGISMRVHGFARQARSRHFSSSRVSYFDNALLKSPAEGRRAAALKFLARVQICILGAAVTVLRGIIGPYPASELAIHRAIMTS